MTHAASAGRCDVVEEANEAGTTDALGSAARDGRDRSRNQKRRAVGGLCYGS